MRRSVLLILLGLAPSLLRMDWDRFRPVSVLGLIGAAYFVAAMVVIHRSIRGQAAWMVGLLAGYSLAMFWIPVPNVGAGVITPGGNLAGFIDSHLLPGRLHQGVFDPEGLSCTLPAAAIALMGALAGHLLRSVSRPSARIAAVLASAGVACIFSGHVCHVWFPIIKAIWSTSFILVAGGWSLLLLAVFYLIVEVAGFRRWPLFFFIPIGQNAITIYVARYYGEHLYPTERLIGRLARWLGEGVLAAVVLTAGVIAVQWFVLYFLHRKKILLRA